MQAKVLNFFSKKVCWAIGPIQSGVIQAEPQDIQDVFAKNCW